MEYIVQPGDTVYEIAKRFGCTVDQIVAANPNLKDPNLIYPGEVLEIPEAAPDGHPDWCCLVLWPCHNLVTEPGIAMADMEGAHRMNVMARKLPKPKEVEGRCAKYMVWVLVSTDPLTVRTCFTLQPAYFADVWFSSKEVDGLCRQDHIQVTAEPMEHGMMPTGPVIMANHMGNCCREN